MANEMLAFAVAYIAIGMLIGMGFVWALAP